MKSENVMPTQALSAIMMLPWCQAMKEAVVSGAKTRSCGGVSHVSKHPADVGCDRM